MPVVASIRLADCPLGFVFNPANPDERVEQQFFPGWVEPYREPVDHSPSYRPWVVRDEPGTGMRVLEHSDKRNSGLLAGSPRWTDVTVEADVRQILANSQPNLDDEYNRIGRTGLVVRHRTTRRFYHFGPQGYDDFVLCRRADGDWIELGRAGRQVDRARYCRLKLEAVGNRLRAWVDGDLVIDLTDDAYPDGQAGYRTNTLSRLASLTVTMTPPQAAAAEAIESRHAEVTRRRAANCPAMQLWREVPFGEGAFIGFGQHADTPEPTVLVQPGKSVLRALTLGGRTLWEHDYGAPLLASAPAGRHLRDLTGDGCTDLVVVLGDWLAVIDGATGSVRRQVPSPPAGPFTDLRGAAALGGARPVKLATAQLLPPPAPPAVYFSEDSAAGANTVWAFDADLQPLWTTHVDNPKFGHSTFPFDIDGDGCDEILAGCHLLNQDGSPIWTLEGAEYWDRFNGARHVDESRFLDLTGNPADGLRAIFSAGAEGVFIAEAATGKVLANRLLGHVQFTEPGRFRPDLPGRQLWCSCRHGNFGIQSLLDCNGRELFQFQPSYELVRAQAVAWVRPGEHLALFAAGPARGLYDAEGHRVVELPPREQTPVPRQFAAAWPRDFIANGLDQLAFANQGSVRIYTQANM